MIEILSYQSKRSMPTRISGIDRKIVKLHYVELHRNVTPVWPCGTLSFYVCLVSPLSWVVRTPRFNSGFSTLVERCHISSQSHQPISDHPSPTSYDTLSLLQCFHAPNVISGLWPLPVFFHGLPLSKPTTILIIIFSSLRPPHVCSLASHLTPLMMVMHHGELMLRKTCYCL